MTGVQTCALPISIQYTDDMLADVQEVIQKMVETSNTHYEAMMNDFQGIYATITSNREELMPQPPSQPEETKEAAEAEPEQS